MNTASEAADIPVKPRKWLPIGLAFSLPGIVLLKMGFFLLIIGMFPTMLTLAAQRTPKAYVISTMAAFNFAGVFPELLGMTLQHNGSPIALLDWLSDPSVWLSMYGAALLGWAFVWLSPNLARIVLESINQGRMRHLENLQKKLEEEWGSQITGEKK